VSRWLVPILPYLYFMVLAYENGKSRLAGRQMYLDLSAGAVFTWKAKPGFCRIAKLCNFGQLK
jgi:hypothetical protein